MPLEMKRIHLRPRTVALGMAGLLLLALLGCELAGWPFLRQPLAQRLGAQLQRDVRLDGNFSLHLLGSIRLRVGQLRIAAPGWETGPHGSAAPPLVVARDAHLVLPYRTVLGQLRGDSSPLQVHLLEVGSIDARLRRLPDGRANWRFERPAGARGQAPAEAVAPEFTHLVVHKGELSLHDSVAGLELEALARTREGTARDAAGLFVRASGSYKGQRFTAEARSPGILPLVAPRGRTRPVALVFSARLGSPGRRDSEFRFRGKAQDLLRFEGLDGSFRLAGASLAAVGNAVGVTLPSTDAFFMQGRITKQETRWQVGVTQFDVGSTHLTGDFRYDSARQPPLLAGQLRGRQLVLRDLAPAFGASPAPDTGTAERRKTATAGRVLPSREFDIPSLRRMEADIDVRIDRVDLGSEALRPLEPLQAQLTLRGGVLRLDHLLARTAQGELQGELQLDARQPQPLWTGDLRWSGIHLSDWIRQRNPFARNEAVEADRARRARKAPEAGTGARDDSTIATAHFVTGELAGQARVRGEGRSTAGMLGSLEGDVYLWIRQGTVSHLLLEAMGLDIAEGLGLVIKGDSNLPLRCAAMSLKARQGVLHTEAGVVDTPDTLLLLSGTVSLAEETFGLRVEARPHDRSLLSVRAPLRLRGSFSAPKVRPEMEKMGGKAVLATVLGTLLAPLAALLPLVDPGEKAGGQGCAATLARLKQKPGTPAAMKRALGEKPKP